MLGFSYIYPALMALKFKKNQLKVVILFHMLS